MLNSDERDVIRTALSEAIELTKDLDPSVRPELCGVLAEHLLRAPRPASLVANTLSVVDRSGIETAGVALSRVQGRSQVDQIAAVVAWYWETQQRAATVADVRGAYASARIPPPGNISESLARTVRRGWITGSDGAYRITQQGRQRFER